MVGELTQLECYHGCIQALFRKSRTGRQGGRVTQYVRVKQECMKLCLGTGDELAGNLWVGISGQMLWWVSAIDCLIRKK